MKTKTVIIIFCAFLPLTILAQQEILSMNKGWSFKYYAAESKEIEPIFDKYFYKDFKETVIGWSKNEGWSEDDIMQSSYNDSTWRKINVPLDFVIESVPSKDTIEADKGFLNIHNEYKGYFKQGIGLYRKVFDLDTADAGKRIWIRFEGIAHDAKVFLNGFKVGEHPSWYTPFRVDISDVVHRGNKKNVLIVVCDSRQGEGWWYEGGGIYRPVYLEKSGGSLYFEPDGIAVNPSLSTDYSTANVEVYYTIQNMERKNRKFEIVSKITDQSGIEINSSSILFEIEPWGKTDFRTAVKINSPKLWSLEQRNLYFVESEIKESGFIVERNKTRFGIRHIVFDANRGLFLNGKHVKVMGASVHQDNGCVGVAVPAEIIRYRIQTMKKFGFNGYRSAHNAASPALLDACDEEGMLVVNEQRIPETSPRYLEEMREIVRYSRNHPSVFLYNLANEEALLIDTDYESGLVSTLMQEISRLDPQKRAITMNREFWKKDQINENDQSHEEYLRRAYSGAGRIVDVAGFSYCENMIYDYEGNGQPIIQTESSGNMCTRGIYETNKEKFWVSSIPEWKTH